VATEDLKLQFMYVFIWKTAKPFSMWLHSCPYSTFDCWRHLFTLL